MGNYKNTFRKLKLINWIRARLAYSSCSNILSSFSDCETCAYVLFILSFPTSKKKGMDCSDLIFSDAFSQCYRVQTQSSYFFQHLII